MGETLVLRAIRERVQVPGEIPLWVYCGSSTFAALVAVVSLIAGGSSLPLVVQVALVGLALVPWLPTGRSWLSWDFVVISMTTAILFTWTGGSYLFFGLLALSAWRCALAGTFAGSLAYGIVAALIVVGAHFVGGLEFNWLMWKTYVELGVALGWAMNSQRVLVVRARETRDEHAQLAALETRRAIARDVHDVLAHTLTILMVHLNSARLALRDDPEEAAVLLDEVAAYGRHCLGEIRSTVGLSDPTGGPRAQTPIEAADAIEKLAETYRDAGVDVDLRLDVEMAHMGLLSEAPPALWHSGYRIVQESLANAVKHAPGSRIDIHIGVDDSGLHLVCANTVSPGGVVLELPSGGNGLAGMRERVAAGGGTFSAGFEGTKWVVRAEMPLGTGGEASRDSQTLGRAS